MSKAPSLRRERQILREIVDDLGPECVIAGIDEVGRGALAGPVTVGVVLVSLETRSAPTGLRDSKLLSALKRADLVPHLLGWGIARGVGHASNQEIDALGITSALALAGLRALENCGRRPDAIVLDGHHDWLSPPRDLFTQLCGDENSADVLAVKRREVLPNMPRVQTVIGGDMTCASIAAASVLAKVERDAHMVELAANPAHEPYGWDGNKGYGARQHLEALAQFGRCDHHRQSWDFPCARERVRCDVVDTGGLDAVRRLSSTQLNES